MKKLANFLFGNKEVPVLSVPEDTRVYCIGDIHGRHDLLIQLFGRIIIVYLGDFIDRGMDSKAVVDTLINEVWPGVEYVFLRGNHEQSLLSFLQEESVGRPWITFGGQATLASYGVHFPKIPTRRQDFLSIQGKLRDKIPESHIDFFRNTTISYEIGSYFFAHAGVRPSYPLSRQKHEDIMWIRDEFLNSKKNFEKIVVHGHTVVNKPEILPNRIGIDTGAYATGVLTCLVLEKDRQRLIQTGSKERESDRSTSFS